MVPCILSFDSREKNRLEISFLVGSLEGDGKTNDESNYLEGNNDKNKPGLESNC